MNNNIINRMFFFIIGILFSTMLSFSQEYLNFDVERVDTIKKDAGHFMVQPKVDSKCMFKYYFIKDLVPTDYYKKESFEKVRFFKGLYKGFLKIEVNENNIYSIKKNGIDFIFFTKVIEGEEVLYIAYADQKDIHIYYEIFENINCLNFDNKLMKKIKENLNKSIEIEVESDKKNNDAYKMGKMIGTILFYATIFLVILFLLKLFNKRKKNKSN